MVEQKTLCLYIDFVAVQQLTSRAEVGPVSHERRHRSTDLGSVTPRLLKQADAELLALVVHGDHVEADGLWDGQDDGDDPDEGDLDGHPLWDANAFDSTP